MASEKLQQWCDDFQKKTVEKYIATNLLDDDCFKFKKSALWIAISFGLTSTLFGMAWGCFNWFHGSFSHHLADLLTMMGLASGFFVLILITMTLTQRKTRRGIKSHLRTLTANQFIAHFKMDKLRDPRKFDCFNDELHRPEVEAVMEAQHSYSIGDPLTLKQSDIEQLSLILTPEEFVSFSEYVKIQGQCKFMQVLDWLECEALKSESKPEMILFNETISRLLPGEQFPQQAPECSQDQADVSWQIQSLKINRLADLISKKQ